MLLGQEQIYHPSYSKFEKAYIAILGMPIVGLRIRARNIFSLVPRGVRYKRILDAGSGPGVFSFELGRRFPDAAVLGVDVQKEAVEACWQIAKKTKAVNVDFRQVSIENLQADNTFDLVLCVDILEHVVDDSGALRKLYNAAAQGGKLVLHVPSLYRRYPVWKKSLNFDVETHVRVGYDIQEIHKKVIDAGFSIDSAGFTYGFLETLANNLSYMITRARMKNRFFYSLAFPILILISLFGAKARPKKLGAGIFVVATKKIIPSVEEISPSVKERHLEIEAGSTKH